jgi:hypothetical protein
MTHDTPGKSRHCSSSFLADPWGSLAPAAQVCVVGCNLCNMCCVDCQCRVVGLLQVWGLCMQACLPLGEVWALDAPMHFFLQIGRHFQPSGKPITSNPRMGIQADPMLRGVHRGDSSVCCCGRAGKPGPTSQHHRVWDWGCHGSSLHVLAGADTEHVHLQASVCARRCRQLTNMSALPAPIM